MGKPWRFTGTDMAPNLVLMAKLLVVVLIGSHTFGKLGDPFLPYWSALDGLRSSTGWFALVLRGAFVIGAGLLLFNLRVRAACRLLGGSIVLWQFAALPEFRNHIFLPGCLLLLAGCHRRDDLPWLIRWQFCLMYFGAGLNKALLADWWNGQVIEVLLAQELRPPAFHLLSQWVAPRTIAIVVSWLTIGQELGLAVCFARRRWQTAAVWLVVAFHGGMFAFLGGYRFGHFVEDVVIGLLAFVRWPSGTPEVKAPARVQIWLAPLLRLIDWDRIFRLDRSLPAAGPWLEVHRDGERAVGVAALRWLLLRCPGFYCGYFAADWFLQRLLPGPDWPRYVPVALAVMVMALFIPWPCRRSPMVAKPGEGAETR